MSEKERKAKIRKRNAFSNIAYLAAVIMIAIGLISVGLVGGSKLLGYEIEISKPSTNNISPKSVLFDSPNNQYHILQQIDNEQEFWKSLQNIESNPEYRIIYYTATPYQREDGTWGEYFTISYQTGHKN